MRRLLLFVGMLSLLLVGCSVDEPTRPAVNDSKPAQQSAFLGLWLTTERSGVSSVQFEPDGQLKVGYNYLYSAGAAPAQSWRLVQPGTIQVEQNTHGLGLMRATYAYRVRGDELTLRFISDRSVGAAAESGTRSWLTLSTETVTYRRFK